MSTRSLIGRENADGTVSFVYCHSDGYPQHVGRVLAEHYADAERVDALIALGNLSALHERLCAAEGEEHSFDKRAPGATVAYGRDRGESDQGADTAPDAAYYRATSRGTEYWYLYRSGAWMVSSGRIAEFRPVDAEVSR